MTQGEDMIYTTVIWNSAPEVGSILQAKAAELLNGAASDIQYAQAPDLTIIVRRSWPDTATAEAWIEFVLQYNPVSAVIDTEA